MRAKYESLKTELDFARRQCEADAGAVVAMTTHLDDAEAEKRQLQEERRRLTAEAHEAKSLLTQQNEAFEKEVSENGSVSFTPTAVLGSLHTRLFLDAPSHLYKRVYPSVRPSVRPSPVIFRRVLGASCAVYPALFMWYERVLAVLAAFP